MTKRSTEQKMVVMPSAQELDKRFEPYALQLGWLAYAWNALHDRLGDLFWTLTGLENGKIPLAIWNSIQNDRSQREMVRALVEVVLAGDERKRDDVRWILSKAQEFEDRRNDALHTPFTFMIDADGPNLTSKWLSGHKRALKLKGKDLLREFEWYGRTANTLGWYVWHVNFSLRDPSLKPWPDRPELPLLGQSPTRKAPRRRTGAK